MAYPDKPPRHLPARLIRLAAGEDVVMGATRSRGAPNAKAKRELGWTPGYPTWHQGFPAVYRQPQPRRRLGPSGPEARLERTVIQSGRGPGRTARR